MCVCVFCRLNSDVAYASTVNLNLLFWTQHGHAVLPLSRFSPILRTSTNIFTQSWQGSNTLQLNVNQFFHAREIIFQQKSGVAAVAEAHVLNSLRRKMSTRKVKSAWDHFKLIRRALIFVIVLMFTEKLFISVFYSFSFIRRKKNHESSFFCGLFF